MNAPLAYATCLVVRSSSEAQLLTRHVRGDVFVTWPGSALTALRFDQIIVLMHPEEFRGSPRNREWFDSALRTRLVPSGRITGDYLDEKPYNPNKPFVTLAADILDNV